jgi:alcohol dehydrogenase
MKTSSIKDFNFLIKKHRFNKIFILTGKNSFYKSKACDLLKIPKNKSVKFYFKLSKLPEFNELIKIILEIYKFKPDVILAIGGGAVIDYAKICSIVNNEQTSNLKKKLINYLDISKKKTYPLIAVPTTAGSGAEVTSNAVIYINKIKYSVESNLLVPDYFFLIEELIIKNSFQLKSASGFDAIAQAMESLISLKSNKSSVYFAKQSLKLSLKNYLPFLNKPTRENSKQMLLASNLAGKAINISKTTAPHAVSYPFTSLFGIDHGHAVSLTLEKFLLFNYKNMKYSNSNFDLSRRYKIIFELFNVKNVFELNQKLKFIKSRAKLVDTYKDLNIDINSSINKILDQINILRLKNNPVDISKNDLIKILHDKIL